MSGELATGGGMAGEPLQAVVFDWRGTLVTTLTPLDWVRVALQRLGRDHDLSRATEVWSRVAAPAGEPDRLDAPGVDTSAARHRDVYHDVFADAGLDTDLAETLYAVESDWAYNRFAVDAAPTLRTIAAYDVRLAVVSDIHFDLRPAFAAAGIDDVVDSFVLSYEHGVQKPDPAIFQVALDAVGVPAARSLMVGDRQLPDGGALDIGMTTLLLPPLTDAGQRRLHRVSRLLGIQDPTVSHPAVDNVATFAHRDVRRGCVMPS